MRFLIRRAVCGHEMYTGTVVVAAPFAVEIDLGEI